ncbi:DUF945 family protein [Campylobacter sp. US33a]|uniref:DUF945 family protein n=1 Tax=Campylobacter sp. US33a TaxID=2498120 RepID=UPI001068C452|nr:DUF945 family protein [Campylobacter sp. US33a]TEY04487.1 hypothetical protein ELQ16_00210 [Campylobacter sp. US33a]
MRKKLFGMIIFVLILLYFIQIYFMGLMNEKIVTQILNEKRFFQVQNINYQKGFFNSHLEFDIFLKQEEFDFLSPNLENYPLHMKLEISHNIFSKNTFLGVLENTSKDFEAILEDNIIAKINAKFFPFMKNDILISLPSIDFSDDMAVLKLDKMDIVINLDETKIYTLGLKINKLQFSSNQDDIILTDLSYDEKFKEGIEINNFGKDLKFGNSSLSLKQIQIQKSKIEDLLISFSSSKNDISAPTFDLNLDLKIKSLILKNDIFPMFEGNFQNIFLNLEIDKISKKAYEDFIMQKTMDIKVLIREFLSFNPFVKLNNFSFSKNENKFISKADAKLSLDGYKVNVHAQSDVGVGEFFPILNLTEGFFIEKDGKFYLDLKANTMIRGEESMELNGKSYALEGLVID